MGKNTFWFSKKEKSNFQGQKSDIANYYDLETELSESLKEFLEITFNSNKNLH